MRKTLKALVVALVAGLLAITPATGFAKGGPNYGGGKHSGSHGGSYKGGKGSSHKGGTYKNSKTGNQYGKHK